jgi:hypothetical protein
MSMSTMVLKSIDRIRFTRLVTFDHAKFVPSSCQLAKFLPSSNLAARKLGHNIFSTYSSSNVCQIQIWQPCLQAVLCQVEET